MWTEFFDMSSGGSRKIKDYGLIYIELPYDEAVTYFIEKFGRYPHNITCDCCGEDFSVSSEELLEDFGIPYSKKILVIKKEKLDHYEIE